MLQVATAPPTDRLRLSRYVDMDVWGFSDSRPMYTWGAGPCLNVVVHRQNRGCFSHIGQYPTIPGASDDMDTLLSKTQLYHKACFTIRTMIRAIGSTTNIEIWLGAGHAYRNASIYSTRDIPRYDFDAYLTHFLQEMACNPAAVIDDRRTGPLDAGNLGHGTNPGPGDVVYDPVAERVYYLTREELRTAQESMTQPDTFGRCV